MAKIGCGDLKAICVRKTKILNGTIEIQGSKNTVLPIMAATLLTSGVSVIHNCPMIEDVMVMCRLLECLHAKTELKNHVLTIDTREVSYEPLPCTLTTRLRSSVLLLGPILARWQKVELGVPGGCSIGLRPIDIHLEGFVKMNVDIAVQNDVLEGNTYYLQGCEYHLRFPSVGATENLLMAAVLAKGRTILRGAAREPEIVELCNYLCSMGALIEGIGTDTLLIKGTKELTATDYCNVYDRIVAGTYLLMAAAIPSCIYLKGIEDIAYMKNVIQVASDIGVNIVKYNDCLKVESLGRVKGGVYHTGIYPEFPTDLLPVLVAVLTQAKQDSQIEETIFESRFGIVDELKKLGVDCRVENMQIEVKSNQKLVGDSVCALDLRQGAAMLIAGMLGEGCTTIHNIMYIKRGYEDIVRDLQEVGVWIDYIEG